MINIKYILPIFILFLLTSCSDDSTDEINYEGVTVDTIIEANSVSAEDDLLNFTVTLPNSFETDIDMRVLITMDDARTKSKQIVIPSGESVVSGTMYLPNADDFSVGYNGNENGATIEVVGGVLAEPIVGKQYLFESNKQVIKIFDKVASLNTEALTIMMDWDSATQADLDLYINKSDGSNVDSAETGSRYETVNLNTSADDETYTVNVGVYNTTIDNIPYKFFVRQPSGQQSIIEGTFENVSSGDSIDVLTITKNGDTFTIN